MRVVLGSAEHDAPVTDGGGNGVQCWLKVSLLQLMTTARAPSVAKSEGRRRDFMTCLSRVREMDEGRATPRATGVGNRDSRQFVGG
jgi:hypothetical protein